MPAPRERPPSPRAALRLLRLLPLLVLGGAALALIASGWHHELSMEALIRRHALVEAYVALRPATALAGFVALYTAVAALAVPGAAALTIAGGLVFGTIVGGIGTMVGATAGATLLFLAARTALGGWLMGLAGAAGDRLARGLRRDAFGYLLVLRLVPLVPFWLVNIVAAVAGLGLRPFVAATVIGIAPATFAFAFVGAGLDSVIRAQAARQAACVAAGTDDCAVGFDLSTVLTPELLASLAALAAVAAVPLAVRRWRAARRAAGDEAGAAPDAPWPP